MEKFANTSEDTIIFSVLDNEDYTDYLNSSKEGKHIKLEDYLLCGEIELMGNNNKNNSYPLQLLSLKKNVFLLDDPEEKSSMLNKFNKYVKSLSLIGLITNVEERRVQAGNIAQFKNREDINSALKVFAWNNHMYNINKIRS